MIRREGKWKALVTYADTYKNHTGQIYKATNWTYIGVTPPTAKWVDSSGRQVAIKSTVSRTKKQMEDLGHIYLGRFAKHKYVMYL